MLKVRFLQTLRQCAALRNHNPLFNDEPGFLMLDVASGAVLMPGAVRLLLPGLAALASPRNRPKFTCFGGVRP